VEAQWVVGKALFQVDIRSPGVLKLQVLVILLEASQDLLELVVETDWTDVVVKLTIFLFKN
jgi:hypothetical protein